MACVAGIVWFVQRDRDEISELKQQLSKMAKRDKTLRLELAEQKKTATASAASSAEKLKTAQNEKIELQTALDEVNVISFAILVFLFIFVYISAASLQSKSGL